MNVAEGLRELLMEDKTAIAVPFGNGFFDIYRSVVLTWIIMAVIMAVVLWLTGGMKVHDIGRRQVIAESIVTGLYGLVGGVLGEGGKQYREYICTVLIYLGAANISGIFGVTPPTMDLCVTAALALMSIVLVEYAGIHAHGLTGKDGWLAHFSKPVAVVAPMNVLEIFIRPLSLCMRLFGNILGATVIMELPKMVVPVFVPAILSVYFDLFDGLIQAYVFVFLTSLYIKSELEE